jgi:hypothetical protein
VAQSQGRAVAAADLYQRYRESTADEPQAVGRDEAERFLRELKAPVCPLIVLADSGALLLVDGRVAGTLPLSAPLLLAPGPHRFRLEIGSHGYDSDELAVPADRPAELRLSPGGGRSLVAVLSLPPVIAVVAAGPSLDAATTAGLNRELAEALQKERALAVPRDRVGAALPQPAAACSAAADCLLTVGQRTQAAWALGLAVRAGAGGCTLHGQLIDVAAGEPAAERDAPCEGGSLQRAIGPARALAAELLAEGMARRRGTLEVTSAPPGASVRIDGRPRGQTPLSLPAFTGDHTIQVERAGFAPVTATLPVEVGKTASLAVRLTSLAGK